MPRISVTFSQSDLDALSVLSGRLKCSKSALINGLCSDALQSMLGLVPDPSAIHDGDSQRLTGESVDKIRSRIEILRAQLSDAEVQLGLFIE